MRTTSSCLALTALLALSGCPFESAEDRPTASEPDGGASSPDDGGAGGSREIPWDWDRDGGPAGGSGGGGGSGGSGGGPVDARPVPPATPPLSNTSGAEFVYVAGASSGMRLKSARLTQETIAGTTFQEWLAEVVNEGSQVMCLTKVTAEYKDSSGSTLAKPLGYVDGPPYQGFGTVSSSCLAPGDHGALWDFSQVPRAFSLSLVRRVELNVDVLPTPDRKPHPSAPVVTPGLVSDSGTGSYWSLRGTLRAVANIHNYGVHVYPIGGDGLLLGSLTASMPGALLPAGTTWNFQTSGAKQRFSNQMIFASFIDGPPKSPAVPRPGMELVFEEREMQRRISWARSREVAAAREQAMRP